MVGAVVYIVCSSIMFVINKFVKKVTNVRPAFFYTKPFVYNSVAICLIMNKLLHNPG